MSTGAGGGSANPRFTMSFSNRVNCGGGGTCCWLFGVGDAADYDSVAFFGYAALFCILLLALDVQLPVFAALGSGSYFIYLWHIFIVMILRDHAELRQFGSAANFAITYTVTALSSIVALLAVRAIAPPRMIRWLGA